MENGCAKLWRVAGKARRRSIAARSVTEEQRRQQSARASPGGLQIFDDGTALLVGHRSSKDLLPPQALPRRQSPTTHPFPIYEMGSSKKFAPRLHPIHDGERILSQHSTEESL